MLAVESENSRSSNQDMLELKEMSDEYYAALKEATLLTDFGTDRQQGLNAQAIADREQQFGKNELKAEKKQSAASIFFHQFQSSVVYLLLAAALASVLYHEMLQAIGIMLAVLINAITGFYMEYKAGVSLEGLKGLSGETIRCIRAGLQSDLPVSSLVPGDLVILEAGSRVPADIRLIEAANLSIDESPLTGESVPVFKDVFNSSTEEELNNIAYHGTLVAGGRGLGVVLRTGMKTSLGRLGKLLDDTESGATPLERQLEKLGQQLSVLTIIICSVVTLVGIVQKQDILLMVETGVALAVAAIPEGLPVLATLALAMGIQRMVRNHAIVRHLAAMETLGCTSIICTDKTGTLTENLMTVCKLYFDGSSVDVEANGYSPSGRMLLAGTELRASNEATLAELIKAGFLCNDAKLEHSEKDGWHVHGDPTEGALLTLAGKCDIDTSLMKMHRSLEIPFDLTRKRMSTIHHVTADGALVYTKGAPGPLIAQCSSILYKGMMEPLADERRAQLMLVNEGFAKQGLRVLAFAKKTLDSLPDVAEADDIESEMTFLGLVAFHDAPRFGVKDAVTKCKNAGIQVVMLTGDQAQTARAVASELGILDGATAPVLTGPELNAMSSADASSALQNTNVLARVTPELKLSIVKMFQDRGAVVSMTGDGVNDAPALKQANIGVAMGLKGTDLARSVSQMVIADDNFCTIVKAIEQGRVIYGNIQRAVGYLLTASLASVLTVAFGILCKVGLPLSPLQLLWLNLIMHIFPGLGIVMERAQSDVMNAPPRDPAAKIMGPTELKQIFLRSLVVSITVLFSVFHAEKISADPSHTTTIGLSTLSLCLLFQAWAWLRVGRGKDGLNWSVGSAMIINMMAAYFMFFAAIYIPGLKDVLGTISLGFHELLFCLGLALLSLLATTGVCAIAIKK